MKIEDKDNFIKGAEKFFKKLFETALKTECGEI